MNADLVGSPGLQPAFDQRGMGRSGKPARDYTMADYADDATLVLMPGPLWPDGALVGKTEVKKFFDWLKGPEILPGAQSMVVTTKKIGPNTMYFHFTQFPGTPKEVKGYDIFVFRAGKIIFQTTFVTDAPK